MSDIKGYNQFEEEQDYRGTDLNQGAKEREREKEKEREKESEREKEKEMERQREIENMPPRLAANERRDYDYDSFDTYLFYSFFILKKWFVFTLLALNLNVKNPAEAVQKAKNFIWAKDDGLFKRFITILVMIPIFIVLAIYAILIGIIALVIGLVCLTIFVLFIDLPFMIVLAIQLTLLLLLVFYTSAATCESLALLFLESGIWYSELVWMILFVGLMLKEYDDMGSSIVFIATYYRNKKIQSRFFTWFYIIISCWPQFVQFLVTSYCAWVSVQLIFENTTYLAPFTHFAGLFVILQVDSFIMEFIKLSKLYVPPTMVFSELETWRREEREAEQNEYNRRNEETLKRGESAPPEVKFEKKLYTWDQLHFNTRFIEKFFGLKSATEASHFLYDPKLDDEEDGKIVGTRLTYLKYAIMALGMGFIIYNFVVYVIMVTCEC